MTKPNAEAHGAQPNKSTRSNGRLILSKKPETHQTSRYLDSRPSCQQEVLCQSFPVTRSRRSGSEIPYSWNQPSAIALLTIPLRCRIRLANGKHHMAILTKIFTTRTLLQIIFVLTATLMMKAVSSHYDFSWATAPSTVAR